MKDGFAREHVYLRLSVTDRCNLRCAYCAPAGEQLPSRHGLLSFEELERLARIFAELGIKKLRLTGGEPTLRRGIVELCRRLGQIPGIGTMAMTTNGVQLSSLAEPLFRAGLRSLNVSLDSIRRDRFAALTGRDLLPAVMAGIDAALAAGFVPLKVNTVVMAGVNGDELVDLAALARDRPLEIRLIEFMPFEGNGWEPGRFLSADEMLETLRRTWPLVADGNVARTGGVARDFTVPGFVGSVSLVTPFSNSFCQRCNRLRLTARGELKTCLYSAPELDLAKAMREGASDQSLADAIVCALRSKPECHPPLAELGRAPHGRMGEIGG